MPAAAVSGYLGKETFTGRILPVSGLFPQKTNFLPDENSPPDRIRFRFVGPADSFEMEPSSDAHSFSRKHEKKMQNNHENETETKENEQPIGYQISWLENGPHEPIPIFNVPKDGPIPPGWVMVPVSGILHADGFLELYDPRERFKKVTLDEATKTGDGSE